MSSRILGLPGKIFSWFLYLFICYASLVAYAAVGGLQLARAFEACFFFPISKEIGSLIFIVLLGAVIFLGPYFVGRINAILFGGMVLAYFALTGMGLDEVKKQFLLYQNWRYSYVAIPLLLTAFSFQTMVPSLVPYLKKHVKALRISIIGGTTVSFLIYVVWQWLILGIIPVEGKSGLKEALMKGNVPATQFLHEHVHGIWIGKIAEFFAFFAIATSFLGIAFGLFDFLSDGLRIKKRGLGKWVLGLLLALPTLFFATHFERAFIIALDMTGGFGDSLLNGILPVVMVWVGRYVLNLNSSYRVVGGKILLFVVFLFFSFTLLLEIFAYLGWVFSIYDVVQIMEIHNPEEILGASFLFR